MKRSILTLIALTLIVFASCKKDSDTTEPTSKDIAGKWYTTEMYVENSWVAVKGTCLDGMFAEFKADKSYNSYESCDNSRYSGTYTINDNLITCKVGGATVTYNIIELNGNKATLELKQDDESIRMKAERR